MSDESLHSEDAASPSWVNQINAYDELRAQLAAAQERITRCMDAAGEQFIPGSRVVNCVVHGGEWRSRPRDCERCFTDLLNHLNYCVRVNEFLNARHEKVLAALNTQEKTP